jgi:hypothetical protein
MTIDELPITEPCPIGWASAKIYSPDGMYDAWVSPDAIRSSVNQTKMSTLTDDQKDRIRKARWQLKEHDHRSEETWIHNFEADLTPEREICIWEALARTYRAEVTLRHHNKLQRRQLYDALLTASVCGTVDGVISSKPYLKSYARLEEVLSRFVANLKESWTPDNEESYLESMKEKIPEAMKAMKERDAIPDPVKEKETIEDAILEPIPDGQHRHGSGLPKKSL